MTLHPVSAMPMHTVAQSSVGCWQGFCQMISKAATWAANFFSALAMGIVMFARIYSRELIIGGISFAAGLLIALIFNRCCGCCNKPEEEVQGPQTPICAQTPPPEEIPIIVN